jgi:hypothetical protein
MVREKRAIALLCARPHPDLLEFFGTFRAHGFDVFCFIDDNRVRVTETNVRCIQIEDAECARRGFFSFCPDIKKVSKCAAWDKALYYFCRMNTEYSFVWFLEEDVFIPSCDTLLAIDEKYGRADIISAPCVINNTGSTSGWYWWKHVPGRILPPPWGKAMVCALRLGAPILRAVDCFVQQYALSMHLTNIVIMLVNAMNSRVSDGMIIARLPSRRLGYYLKNQTRPLKYPFIEFIFHTIALRDRKTIASARELETIVWKKEWDACEMDVDQLYHPVKKLDKHSIYRNALKEKGGVLR